MRPSPLFASPISHSSATHMQDLVVVINPAASVTTQPPSLHNRPPLSQHSHLRYTTGRLSHTSSRVATVLDSNA
jgi:hypothetical protein